MTSTRPHRHQKWIADPAVDAIITTGSTGFTGRDVTPEAIEPLFEKRMDGFSIAFHMLSHAKIGTSTVQSRATAGVAAPPLSSACRGHRRLPRRVGRHPRAPVDYRTRPNFVETAAGWTSTAAPESRGRRLTVTGRVEDANPDLEIVTSDSGFARFAPAPE
jgi:hypothetical protein